MAARPPRSGHSLLLHPAHICAWILGFLVFTPLAVYVVLRYPDWALMYTLPPTALGVPGRLGLVALLPVAIAASTLAGLQLLRRRSANGILVLIAISTAATVGLLVWGYERIWRVGSFAAFHDGARNFMPTLTESRLGVALLFGLPALVGAWISTMVTLRRHSRR